MELIETITTTTNTSSITFSNIPNDGHELQIVGRSRVNGGQQPIRVQINGTTSTYNNAYMGYRQSANSYFAYTTSDGWTPDINAFTSEYPSGEYANVMMRFPAYASNMAKTFYAQGGKPNEANMFHTYAVNFQGGVDITSAISTILLDARNTSFTSGCTFSLYKL